jgi:hypothetical protein
MDGCERLNPKRGGVLDSAKGVGQFLSQKLCISVVCVSLRSTLIGALD